MFRFEYGTSNVYAQLGFADAEEIPLKAGIVRDITERIRGRGLTVCQAAILVEASQVDLLLALCGKFQAFRAAELRGWLKRLRNVLEITSRYAAFRERML